jgi:hypothetical protein
VCGAKHRAQQRRFALNGFSVRRERGEWGEPGFIKLLLSKVQRQKLVFFSASRLLVFLVNLFLTKIKFVFHAAKKCISAIFK